MVTFDPVTAKNTLRQEFLADVRVIDATNGYVSASAFNLRMKPSILRLGAQLIAHHFAESHPTSIHGIPHSGNYLATAVAFAFEDLGQQVRLHSSRKDQFIPSAWKDIYHKEIRSFTASQGGIDVLAGITLSFVKKGDKVLVVDDICAHGDTAYAIMKGLLETGVKVAGFAVLFDKVWQGGLERVANLGVPVYSCLRVEEIGAGDRVVVREN